MKALTLWRPWARYVASGEKRIENRPWTPPLKMLDQVIAIHAGKAWDHDGAAYVEKVMGVRPSLWPVAESLRLHPEGIIGTARIAGWCDGQGTVIKVGKYVRFELTKRDREWLFGPFGWILRDAVALPKPIPCRGMQKLWDLPAEVEAALQRDAERRREESNATQPEVRSTREARR